MTHITATPRRGGLTITVHLPWLPAGDEIFDEAHSELRTPLTTSCGLADLGCTLTNQGSRYNGPSARVKSGHPTGLPGGRVCYFAATMLATAFPRIGID